MTSIYNFLEDVDAKIAEFRKSQGLDQTHVLFFRGHAQADWKLIPTLMRIKVDDVPLNSEEEISFLENYVYRQFVENIQAIGAYSFQNSWHKLYLMKHHGFLSRLLDWSTNLFVALYFAVRKTNDPKGAHIWILNPYKFNEFTINRDSLPNPDLNLKIDYEKILQQNKSIKFPFAFLPTRTNPRLIAQQGAFTYHGRLISDLHSIQTSPNKQNTNIYKLSDCLLKINIPDDLITSMQKFLKDFGVTEFSLFPDPDHLAQEIEAICPQLICDRRARSAK